ncbi:hypothetical protein M3152_10620 [Sporosarcina luteola]|uniref:hypothetical protein n=1 Tax=Sporosarcina luteola TaxID=582850 RepID=UPI0020425779|nr:hypothetical protein [Sporosarcina luteola]MCM3638179.1 hypothetical protein [Sporosarcina luteola]
MGIRYSYFVFIIVMLLITAGCSNEKLSNDENHNSKEIVKTEEIVNLTPPKLTVLAEGKKIFAGQGSYSWSEVNDDGTVKNINTHTGPPPEFGGKELLVKSQSEVQLIFEEAPSDYQVRIWETDNDKAIPVTDNTFTITQNKGKVIYEVIANWEQGTATYAFTLNAE